MADIYQNCYMTLCATAAPSDNGGCYKRMPNSLQPLNTTARKRDRLEYSVYVRHGVKEKHLPSWNDRAESKQERLLSPRPLHFTAGELMWECSAVTACQCHPGYQGMSPLMPYDAKKKFKECEKLWLDIVVAYSALNLSFEKDKLPALSGVAKKVLKRRPGDEYLAVLLRNTLLVDLRWQKFRYYTKRPVDWCSPAWSWASLDGGILLDRSVEIANLRNYCTLIDASVTIAGPDSTGAVAAGLLVLSPSAFVAEVHEESNPQGYYDRFSLRGGGLSVTFNVDCFADFEHGLLAVGDQLLCLLLGGVNPMYDDFCLVLKQCGEEKQTLTTYQRAGCVKHAGAELQRYWDPRGTEETIVRIA